MRTYYEILQVPKDAPRSDIRSSYLRLLKIYHPDRNSDPEAATWTSELVEAYEVLGNSDKRAAYDAFLREEEDATRAAAPKQPHARPKASGYALQWALVGFAIMAIPLFFLAYSSYTKNDKIFTAERMPLLPSDTVDHNSSSRTVGRMPSGQQARDTVNRLIQRLSTEVYAKANPTGENRYEILRDRYQPTIFFEIASEIRPYMSDEVANKDDLVTSAYFNAAMMGLSVAVLNGFDNGRDISHEIDQTNDLIQDERIATWLHAVGRLENYQALVKNLDEMRKQPTGTPLNQMDSTLDSLSNRVQQDEAQIREGRIDGNLASEHKLVDDHNHFVALYNELLPVDQQRHDLYDKVELAFNRCLDSNMLLSMFPGANITSSASDLKTPTD